MRHRLILSLLLCLTGATSALAAEPGKPDKRTVVHLDSTLKDEDGKPVSGIFQMQFELRKGKGAAFWKEKRWVAVDNGKYALDLGRGNKLPDKLDTKTAVLVVNVAGAGEILNEPLSGEVKQIEDYGASAGGKRIVPFAEKSGFAFEAERAQSADRIGQYTAKLLAETLDALDKRKAKVKVSKNHTSLSSVGGAGGTPFEMICPPGMVAVGIRGGAGIYIDNFQVVCAPLE